MAGSCFGASDHGPVSFRRVGQSVDLPAKARRWGHDLRGSPQSGCLIRGADRPATEGVSYLLPTAAERAAEAARARAVRGP